MAESRILVARALRETGGDGRRALRLAAGGGVGSAGDSAAASVAMRVVSAGLPSR